ncbi:MAG TPA: hypothetical protein VMA98_03325 [Candidatus Acidoferrales bacterium]|nr:hypothetical protein [Candidatus Acidoferrales bacterium]
MPTVTLQNVVPLVSSGTAGPLGAIHLPRLWAKLTLSAAGVLPEGYDECGKGFDQMTLDALGLDRQKTMDFIKSHHPKYMQFEEWVVAQNGGSISADRIKKHNDAIRGYNHSDDLAGKMRSSSGIKDASVKDAVMLNTIEDLDDLYAQVKK